MEFINGIIRRGVTDGDVIDQHDPEDIAKMLVALWVGIRRTSDLDQPQGYLDNLQRALILTLHSFTNPDRIEYFTQFVRRRHQLAAKKVCAEAFPTDIDATALAHNEARLGREDET